MRRFLEHLAVFTTLLLLVGAVFAVGPGVGVASAATSAGVAVNATPAYVTISNSPDNYGFGVVSTSTNYSTAIDYFTITNGSTVNINVAISCNATWAGGNTWTHSDTGTPGSTTAALYATPGTTAWNIIVKNASPQDLYNNTGSASLDWGLRLCAPTVFDDGVLKTNTVTVTATAY